MSAPQARPANQVPPPSAARQAALPLDRYFYPNFGARAAETLVSQTLLSLCLLFPGVSSLPTAKSVHAALTIGEGVWPWGSFAGCAAVAFRLSLIPDVFSDATGPPEKLGPDPIFLSGRRQRGTRAVLPPVLSLTHSSCKRGFFPLDLLASSFLSAPRRRRMISKRPPLPPPLGSGGLVLVGTTGHFFWYLILCLAVGVGVVLLLFLKLETRTDGMR